MRSSTIGGPGPVHKRLIVLLCDTPIPAVVAKHGNYHDIFSSLFAKSLRAAQSDVVVQVDSFDVVQGEYPGAEELAAADALLLTGSAASAHANEPWIKTLISFVATLPVEFPALKLIGICFGHQIIAMAFGGRCEANAKGWEIGSYEMGLSEAGRRIFGEDGPSIRIHQMHRDHCPVVPPHFEVLGSTPRCFNHGMVKYTEDGSVQVVSLQGHPEFLPDIVLPIIDVREAKGVISKDVAAQSRVYAAEHDDGVAIGAALLRATGLIAPTVKPSLASGGRGA